MRIAWIAVVMTACSSGTSGTPAPAPANPAPVVAPKPPADKFDQTIVELEGLRDKMCACIDSACSDRVEDDHKAWKRAMRDRFRGDDERQPTEAQDERGRAADKAYRDCRRKLHGSGASMADAMAKMSEFKDKMCVCQDKSCADKVTDEMTKWAQEMAKNADRDQKVSDDDIKKMQEETEQFTRCATKAMTAP